MESQRTNGAGEAIVDATVIEDQPVPSTQLVRRERRSEVLHPLDREQLVASFREYQELCRELLDDGDYQSYARRERVNGVWRDVEKRFKKKSAWRKLAAAFDLDVQKVEVEVERDEHGNPLRAHATFRAIAPSGRVMDGTGRCSVTESRFDKDRSKAEHDLPGTAETRAKNRAIADLLGTGEVSAEEVGGGGGNESGAEGLAYGPIVPTALKQAATQAAITLCGGDVEQARGLWAKVQADLGEYMPHAAATALVRAAGHMSAPLPSTPAAPTADAGAAGPDANSPGRLVASLALARGVPDGELAKMMIEAAGGRGVSDRRALAALPGMLARIDWWLAHATMVLVDRHYPARSAPASAVEPATSGDAEPAEAEPLSVVDQGGKPASDGGPAPNAAVEASEIARLQDEALELWARLVPASEAVAKVQDAGGDARVLRILVATAERNLANRDRTA